MTTETTQQATTQAVDTVKNNDALQQAVANIINKATAGVDTAVSFLSTQIPDVIHQLLLWKMVVSSLEFGFGILILLSMFVFIYRILKSKPNGPTESWCWDYYARADVHELSGIGLVLIFCCLAIGAVACFLINFTWLQILIAPKIYLLEYAASIVQGH